MACAKPPAELTPATPSAGPTGSTSKAVARAYLDLAAEIVFGSSSPIPEAVVAARLAVSAAQSALDKARAEGASAEKRSALLQTVKVSRSRALKAEYDTTRAANAAELAAAQERTKVVLEASTKALAAAHQQQNSFENRGQDRHLAVRPAPGGKVDSNGEPVWDLFTMIQSEGSLTPIDDKGNWKEIDASRQRTITPEHGHRYATFVPVLIGNRPGAAPLGILTIPRSPSAQKALYGKAGRNEGPR